MCKKLLFCLAVVLVLGCLGGREDSATTSTIGSFQQVMKETAHASDDDFDGDGIVDVLDEEPGVPSSMVNGALAEDFDGDGIPDLRDADPGNPGVGEYAEVPEGNNTFADFDGDKVADVDDAEPGDPNLS